MGKMHGTDDKDKDPHSAERRIALPPLTQQARQGRYLLIEQLYRIADRIGADTPDATQARTELRDILARIAQEDRK
ncbi:MAG TPA: hypothetical protein VGC40_03585 [Paenirhodobacter sp.]